MSTFSNSTNTPSVAGTAVIGTGTGFSSLAYSSTPTASNLARRDASANLSANNMISGYATTATAAGTTTLTVASAQQQYFTGSTTQTVVLPVTSTLVLGQTFLISNNSSGAVTVQSSGANTIQVMAADTDLVVTVINTGVTTAAGWNAIYSLSGGGGNITLTGDSGTATGSSLVIFSNNATNNSGATVTFIGNNGTTIAFNVSDADNSTFIGREAGTTTTTGENNTGVGVKALGTITSGQSNVAVGQQALGILENGSNNVAIGSAALLSAISTANNIAIGSGALQFLDGTDNNIAIGVGSLAESITDNDNTAVGHASLNALNGGTANVALGKDAGIVLESGSFNTYLGYSAGISHVTGESSNICINNDGVASEFNTLRIGTDTGNGSRELETVFINGINGNTLGGTPLMVTIDSTTSQLGVLAIPGGTAAPNVISGTSATIALVDQGPLQVTTNSSPVTITVPANGTVAFPLGAEVDFFQEGTGQVTFAAAGGVTIESVNSNLSIALQFGSATLVKLATNTWALIGNLA